MPRGSTGFLVTGGGGFVGSHLTRQLLADGEVTVIDNLAVGEAEHVPGDLTVREEPVGEVGADGAPATGDEKPCVATWHLTTWMFG